MPPQVILVIALALVFDFLNGVHGSSNILATMISSRVSSVDRIESGGDC